MLPIGCKVHIPLAIIYIKTYAKLASLGFEQTKIGITSKDVFSDRYRSYASDLPGSWIYPLPEYRKVHMVNCWIPIMCRIGVGCEVYDVTDCRAHGTNPCAPRFYRCGRERAYHIHANAKRNSENKHYPAGRKYEMSLFFMW